jgi:Fic family protein
MKLDRIDHKLTELKAARPLPPAAVASLEAWFRVELTYSSNAIEGNTLSRAETAVVLEKGITVAGKSLKDHLEAANTAAAYDWIKSLVKKKPWQIDENTVLNIHRLILNGIDNESAGAYRRVPVRIAGSPVIMPNPAKVPTLMNAFFRWLAERPELHPAQLAAETHYRLVTIHPFSDGNVRTARLLMNLILMQSGYPPAMIRPKDRLSYIRALEQAQTGGSIDDFEDVIAKAIERSLDIYLKAIRQKDISKTTAPKRGKLLKIGELAKRTGEPVPTLRFWLKEGLINSAQRTPAGYQLFDKDMIERIGLIHTLQDRRLTVAEIREKIAKEEEI